MEVEQEPTTMEPIQDYYASYFSHREFEIAEILVRLPDIISELDYRPRIRVPWGHKKKRSALAVQQVKNKSSSSTVVRFRLPSSMSSPNLGSKVAANNVVKAEGSSPNTPLSFESEENPTQSRSKVVVGCKRKMEQLQQEVGLLKKRKDLLQKELQNVKGHKEKLIGYNLLLQTRKQELEKKTLIQKDPQFSVEDQNLNLDIQLGQPAFVPTFRVICAPTVVKQEHYHQQITPHQYQMQILDHTAQTRKAVVGENHGYLASTPQVASTSLSSNAIYAAGLRLVSCNSIAAYHSSSNGGSVLVPECGFSNQNCGSSLANNNFNKAMYAKNRQERYQKNRVKKTSSILGQRQSQ